MRKRGHGAIRRDLSLFSVWSLNSTAGLAMNSLDCCPRCGDFLSTSTVPGASLCRPCQRRGLLPDRLNFPIQREGWSLKAITALLKMRCGGLSGLLPLSCAVVVEVGLAYVIWTILSVAIVALLRIIYEITGLRIPLSSEGILIASFIPTLSHFLMRLLREAMELILDPKAPSLPRPAMVPALIPHLGLAALTAWPALLLLAMVYSLTLSLIRSAQEQVIVLTLLGGGALLLIALSLPFFLFAMLPEMALQPQNGLFLGIQRSLRVIQGEYRRTLVAGLWLLTIATSGALLGPLLFLSLPAALGLAAGVALALREGRLEPARAQVQGAPS